VIDLPRDCSDPAEVNPFSTRYIRPGAMEFLFPADVSVSGLVDRLRQQRWWGEIVGPHGSGKSSLLAALLPRLEAEGLVPITVTLHLGQRRLGLTLDRQLASQTHLIVVDGYEQLSLFARWGLKRFCRRHRLGLLVTSHRRAGLPTLHESSADLNVAQAIVARLQAGLPVQVTPNEVAEAFQRHAGNVREILLDLYDLYESRRRAAL